jgi:predicted dienelactone hydrolase
VRRAFKGCALLLVLGIPALLGFLWIEHRSEVTLPAPTGPFAVGRDVYDWTDGRREVLAWIWYPAEGGQLDSYLPAALHPAPGRATLFGLLTRDRAKVHAHSHRGAVLSPRQQIYPVVLFRGGASAEVLNYSTLTEDLASHGYIVVGIDAPYRTGVVVFPDGRVVRRARENNPELAGGAQFQLLANRLLAAWIADMTFALDRLASDRGKFAGHVDMTRVGAFGHSFGGAQALQFCHDDPRCKAAIDVDGMPLGSVVESGVGKPVLFVLSDHAGESGSAQVMADIRAMGAPIAVIPGANHFTFSDDGAVVKSSLLRGVLRLFGKLRIDARRQLALTAADVRGFFDAQLKR